VFVIILENNDYDDSFAADSAAPYLAQTLPAQGALLQNYYGIGHVSLDNYIAMISGQGPNPITQSDCLIYLDFIRLVPLDGPDGQAIGTGCVYPTSVPTLVEQLEAKGLTWRGYMEDMGNDPARESATCAHPSLNAQDPTQAAAEDDQYATRHNPFVYFHSIIDDQATCDANVVNLNSIHADLASVATTPNYVFITPNLCHDGHDAPCVNGEPGGLESINAFLQAYVPIILASPAFQKDGLLIVTFDESEGPQSDASGCCGAGPTPNTPLPGATGLGGGRVGAVLLSQFIEPGSVSTADYNHYSMLRSVEDLFGLPYLGYAGASAVTSFGSDVYTRQMPELPSKK
jgi:phosphatidylinositol-3-phosphatase